MPQSQKELASIGGKDAFGRADAIGVGRAVAMKEHRVPLDGVRLSRSYRINGDALNPADTLDADALREPPEMEVDGIGDEGDVRRIAVDERSG